MKVLAAKARVEAHVEAVTTADGLESLWPEWESLWRRCRDATPFQSPAWLIPWWRCFGAGEPLLVLTARRRCSGALAGLLPLYAAEPGRLRLVGAGNTDYLDALAETPRWAGLLLAALGDDGWSECDLQALRPGSALLKAAVPTRWTATAETQDPCPVLTLPGAGRPLDEAVPRRQMQNLRYACRRLDRVGAARFETAQEGNLEELLDGLIRLHAARWGRRGESGVLAQDGVQRFHRIAARELLRCGALRLHGLRLDGRIVASYYGFADARRAYYYLGGFDPALAKLSLGTVIVGRAIKAAASAGAAEFHFLRGAEPYKYAWGAVDRFTRRRLLRRRRSA